MSSLLLTPEQRQIVAQTARFLLVDAVAGSGKTTTLAHCVAYRERQGTPPDEILALVFTDAARQVFQRRLAEAGASRNVRVATYADFARSLLARWREQGIIEGAQVYLANAEAMRPYVLEAIEEAAADPRADGDYGYDLNNLHAEIVINQLSRLKGTLTLARFEDASDAELADSLDLPRGLVSICRTYERMRRIDAGHFAFQSEHDLVTDVLSVCEQIGEYVSLPSPALIVADEWHDANAAQIALLRRLAGPDTRIIAAGDKEQVVHSWNGADPRYMGTAFEQLFPGTRRLPLTCSFRCGATLGACAQALTAQPFQSGRQDDTDVEVIRYDAASPDDCCGKLVEALARIREDRSGRGLADCAVVLRDAHQSIALENAFIEHGIPYAMDGCQSYFDRIEILMLRGILHIARQSMAPVSERAEVQAILRALGLFAALSYTESEWADAERTIAVTPETIRYFYSGRLSRTSEAQETVDPATRRWRARFAQVCDHLIEQVAALPAGELLAFAARELRLADTTRRLFVHRVDALAVARSIDGFIAYARSTGLDAAGLLERLHQAQRRSGAFRKNRHPLTLTTARAAKGKEWRFVHMPFVVDGEFPQSYADPGEERRLFYVAMTRTSDKLFLYTPAAHESHFIRALDLDSARAGARARPAAPVPPGRLYLTVPYSEKDAAKQLGAQWDNVQRKWWISPAMPKRLFAKWLPSDDGPSRS
ncbi:MAG: ATP-dependent helicase [Pigmentiphaga sp.]|uniref:ATP-dependent helicase n=1 Tax=Pigmentiphaga sp. TaxID=1977564 RepID=UPI0029B827AB|nr:ATP-dependent helicase [Pigmentiphaga sp.]MDX3907566.1 ATP-dependent helicase [Pigmentiphaga sp.]